MRGFRWLLVAALGFPATLVAADGAHTRDLSISDPTPSTRESWIRDYERAAQPEAPALVRLLLASMMEAHLAAAPGATPARFAATKDIRAGALRDGSDDLMVLAMSLNSGTKAPGDDVARLRAMNLLTAAIADNAQFGLVLLGQPEISGDAQLSADILHQMAGARSFESPYTVASQALARRFLQTGVTRMPGVTDALGYDDQSLAISTGTVLAAALALPSYAPVVTLCKQPARESVRGDCQQFGRRLLANADTVIDALIAAKVVEWTAPDAVARTQAANEHRRVYWQQMQVADLLDGRKSGNGARSRYLASVLQEAEMEAMRNALRAENLPLDPPTGWKSPSERYQADAPAASPKTPG